MSVVEFDVYDGCGSGCTAAHAYVGQNIVDTAENPSTGYHKLTVSDDGGLLDAASVESYEGTVCEVRLY